MATTIVLHPDPQSFPVGTSVKAYARAAHERPGEFEGVPPGSSVAEATVTSATPQNTLTYSLAEGTYIAYAEVAGVKRYLKFNVNAAAAGGVSAAELATEKEERETADGTKAAKASNLSDLASAAAARTNLGLGTAATQVSTAFDAAGAATSAVATETTARESADSTHAALTTTAHGGIVASSDSRLTDARAPTAGSVALAQTAASLQGPAANAFGLRKLGAGELEAMPGNAKKAQRVGQTFAIQGEVTAIVVPGFFVSLATGQTATLVKCRAKIAEGTKVKFKIQKNGSDITGFGTTAAPLEATSTAATTAPTAVALAEDDVLTLVIVSVEGAPKNLTVSAFLELSS